MTDLSQLTDEQLEEAIAARRREKEKAERKARDSYENSRENLVRKSHKTALQIHEQMAQFKTDILKELEEFRSSMSEYGEVSGNSRGGYSIKSLDGSLRLQYKINTLKNFDERADLAEEKLQVFLESFVKSRNKRIYKLVMSLLERTHSGDFDINMINRLYKMENDFEDEGWREAIRLFKESYSPEGSARYIIFQEKTEAGKWKSIPLNFASI